MVNSGGKRMPHRLLRKIWVYGIIGKKKTHRKKKKREKTQPKNKKKKKKKPKQTPNPRPHQNPKKHQRAPKQTQKKNPKQPTNHPPKKKTQKKNPIKKNTLINPSRVSGRQKDRSEYLPLQKHSVPSAWSDWGQTRRKRHLKPAFGPL